MEVSAAGATLYATPLPASSTGDLAIDLIAGCPFRNAVLRAAVARVADDVFAGGQGNGCTQIAQY